MSGDKTINCASTCMSSLKMHAKLALISTDTSIHVPAVKAYHKLVISYWNLPVNGYWADLGFLYTL